VDKSEEGARAGDHATSERSRFGWEDWAWDASLFEGSAQYYRRGRIPYAEGLADRLATVLVVARVSSSVYLGAMRWGR
jgi:hypothetical protein